MHLFERPETQYVMSGDVSVAFQVFGRGQQDLLYVPGIISHLETNWEEPNSANFLISLGQHFRVIIFDKRGQGMSDRIEGATTLEERIDDLKAVMQAVGSESATIFALSEGGPVSILFAATYPQKVKRLVLFGAMAKFWGNDDYPHMAHIKYMDKAIENVASNWGKGYFAAQAGPETRRMKWRRRHRRRTLCLQKKMAQGKEPYRLHHRENLKWLGQAT